MYLFPAFVTLLPHPQAQKGRMFVRSMAMALASAGTFIASVQFDSNFMIVAFILSAITLRSFYKFGYDKGISVLVSLVGTIARSSSGQRGDGRGGHHFIWAGRAAGIRPS